MINTILVTAGILALVMFGIWLIVMALDSHHNQVAFTFAAFTYWSVAIGAVVYIGAQQTAKGPCVTSEIQMHYNAATKTIMPARVCTLRGEWVNP